MGKKNEYNGIAIIPVCENDLNNMKLNPINEGVEDPRSVRSSKNKEHYKLPKATEIIQSFQINIPDRDIIDLNHRLANIHRNKDYSFIQNRDADTIDQVDFLLKYWQNTYDWKRFEQRIKKIPMFSVLIDNIEIYFIHLRSKNEKALPVLLNPGGLEFNGNLIDIMELLTNPKENGGANQDTFHIVLPFMPNYSFKGKKGEVTFNFLKVAKVYTKLMKDKLGYKKWVAQGGDCGLPIINALVKLQPKSLVAVHKNVMLTNPCEARIQNKNNEFEASCIKDDSPEIFVFFALHKYNTSVKKSHRFNEVINLEMVLDDTSFYWFLRASESISCLRSNICISNSLESQRLLAISRATISDNGVPISLTLYPSMTFLPPQKWVEVLWPNIFYWNKAHQCEQFNMIEDKGVFVKKLQEVFRPFR